MGAAAGKKSALGPSRRRSDSAKRRHGNFSRHPPGMSLVGTMMLK
jgi:hypothetical protein